MYVKTFFFKIFAKLLILDDGHFEEEMSIFVSEKSKYRSTKEYFETKLSQQRQDIYSNVVKFPIDNEPLTICYKRVRYSSLSSIYILQLILIVGKTIQLP